MARRRSFTPVLECLEKRDVPALFGIPWTDGTHLTMSFAPDGTFVDGSPNILHQYMSAQGWSESQWQLPFARAISAWTESSNLNIGFVDDGGQPLGAIGAIQGDARFGDIRVMARPLSANVLAITTPPGYLCGTRAGDIILNSNQVFSLDGAPGTYDLYSVVLQELGHALGVGNSADPNSPMHGEYLGVRTGLTPEDLTEIQILYGSSRAPDGMEGGGGNNTFSHASQLRYASQLDSVVQSTIVVRGDISASNDLDYFRFRTPGQDLGFGLNINLSTDGISTLAPRMQLYGKNQVQLASVMSTNPLQSEVSLFLSSGTFALNTDYFIRVDGGAAGNKFAIGAYQLSVMTNPAAGEVVGHASQQPLDDPHTNDSIFVATKLQPTANYTAGTHFQTMGILRDSADRDYYQVRSANLPGNQFQTLTVVARAGDSALGQAPSLTLYDHYLVAIEQVQILVNGNGTYTMQLENAVSNKNYYIGVLPTNEHLISLSSSQYFLDVDFRANAVKLEDSVAGSLTSNSTFDVQTLEITRDQAMFFLLSANCDPADSSAVRMRVFNLTGQEVFALTAQGGMSISGTTFLNAGTYIVYFEALGTLTGSTTYSVKSATLDDPIGPTLADPTMTTTWKKDPISYYSSLPFTLPSNDIVW